MSLVIPCYNKLCPQRWRPALFLVFDVLSVKSNVYLFLLRRSLIKHQWLILWTTSLIDLPNSNSSIVKTPLRTCLWLRDCSLQRCRLRRRHSVWLLVLTLYVLGDQVTYLGGTLSDSLCEADNWPYASWWSRHIDMRSDVQMRTQKCFVGSWSLSFKHRWRR